MQTLTKIASILLFLVLLPVTHAAEHDHDHKGLTTDPGLTLSELVDRALARTPERFELASQAELASAWELKASSWLSNAPALFLRYQTDRFNQNDNLEEYEAGLELPLWRWGEKTATAALAHHLERETDTTTAKLRWEITGALRRGLWAVAQAEVDLDWAQRAADLARGIAAKVQRAHDLGDLAQTDVLIASSNQLQATNLLIEKQAELVDTKQNFASLTQGSLRPAFTQEVISTLTELPSEHVLLVWLNSQVDRASAERDRLRKSSRGSPSVLLGSRREQAANDAMRYDSFGVTVRFPIATRAQSAPEIAAAKHRLAGVIAYRDHQLRKLQLMYHDASHTLQVLNEQLAAATIGADLARQQIEMSNMAFDAGEVNLLSLLQIQAAALKTEHLAASLHVAQNLAIALYNQAVGETP